MSEKNPAATVIVRNADAFDPKVMISKNKDLLKKKVKNLIQKIVESKIVDFSCGDKALAEYSQLVKTDLIESRELFRSYKRDTRLDAFFFKTLKIEDRYTSLAKILKIIFCLSHGQASVERGFNDNNLVLKDNLGETSVVARRFIKNYLRVSCFEPFNIPIKKDMIKLVKSARQRYEHHLEEFRKMEDKKKEKSDIEEITNEIININSQCRLLEETVAKLDKSFIEMMKKAEKQNNMHLVIEGNALKRKSEEKTKQLAILRKKEEELQSKKIKLSL